MLAIAAWMSLAVGFTILAHAKTEERVALKTCDHRSDVGSTKPDLAAECGAWPVAPPTSFDSKIAVTSVEGRSYRLARQTSADRSLDERSTHLSLSHERAVNPGLAL
jgi:hypothetical protein